MQAASREKNLSYHHFYKLLTFSLMFLFTVTLLTACGGGGGGGGDTVSVKTGVFIDSPVQGLGYQTATQEGTTDGQGSFKYMAGEEITFAIGDVVLGTTFAKAIITPLDLVAGAADETDTGVTNRLRLLQSLDEDGNPANNIHITGLIASEVSGRSIDFNTDVENFDNGAVADLLDTLTSQGAFSADTPRNLRTAEQAREHFRQVLDDTQPSTELAASFSVTPASVIVQEQAFFNGAESTGEISEYQWDFGDGKSGTGVETSHVYAQVDTYLATLTVIDESGNEASVSLAVVVNAPPNEPPIAMFTPKPATGQAPVVVSFVPTGSSDPDGEIVRYSWDFGDGKTAVGRIANHTYAAPGNYLAKLTVTDDDGATAEKTAAITVTGPDANLAPTASFAISPETGEAPLQISFNGSASSDPDGSLVSYSWNFGDGHTGSGVLANHTYAAAGTYEASLIVTDNLSATASTSRAIIVLETGQADCDTNNPCDVHATCDDTGAEISCSCNSGWTGNGYTCTEIVAECTNNDTRPDGGSACGLNNRGEYGRICVAGQWQNNTGVCSDPDVCTDGSSREGTSACGLNDNGTLRQECVEGEWANSEQCDDPDVCTNGATREGTTPCSEGYYRQLCGDGQWEDTTECISAAEDADGDGVSADVDPNDADFTVCGDSDGDGCDDCSVTGFFDPDNDGWDENGDGNCELPLDYGCMNGANAAADPYRLQACIQFTYVNQDREHFSDESDNAAPLVWNEDIWEVAIAHTIDMCENSFFAHTNLSGQGPSDRAAAAGLSYGLAENIAINLDPGAAQYAFMEEPTCVGHRANVLEPRAIEAGIGYHVCDNPSNTQWDGYQFVTQDFRWNFSIGASAYCQNSSLACQIPPNPPTTAPCPANLISWGFCPVPSTDTLEGWGCQ